MQAPEAEQQTEVEGVAGGTHLRVEGTLGAEFLTEPLACALQTHTPPAPGKGLECLQDRDGDTCFPLRGLDGARQGVCMRARELVQREKMLFQE